MAARRDRGRAKQDGAELRFSGEVRPPIQLELSHNATPAHQIPGKKPLRLPWSPLPTSEATLAKYLDRLILVSAVLLFLTIVLAAIRILPGWPLGLALVIVVTITFAAVYKLLFAVCLGTSPGKLLAQLAFRDNG